VTRTEKVGRHGLSSDHIVQFFDTIDSMADGVSTFLAEGYGRGGVLLVLARKKHWRAIVPVFKERIHMASRLSTGRLTVVEAEAMLGRIMRRGLPDAELFHKTVGEVVRRLANGLVSLRVYGEMVEVLAEEENFYAAQRLEELWNELAARHSFVVLCGYSAAHFATNDARDALGSICRTHTRILRGTADPLADWVLSRR
jgi:hypothetical protein